MSIEVTAIVVALVAVVISAIAIWQARQHGTPISGELVHATIATSTTMAQELTEVALTAAQAAEQLYRTGKIAKSDRLNHAFTYVKQWFPDLDQARIVTAIEAGVIVVNALVATIPSKPIQPTQPGHHP